MPVEIKELADAPIIILAYLEPFNPGDIGEGFTRVDTLASQGKHVYVVNDLSKLSVNFGDLVLGLSQAASAGPGGPGDSRTTHFLIGGDEMVRFVAEAGQQEQYGQVDIKYYPTVDEAIAFARSQLD